jgi:uncharacterized protein YgbK (DUF1537 family)
MKQFGDWMNRLLVVADDFTGSLDTGVQFAQRGARTFVVSDVSQLDYQTVDADVQVLVVNTDSRHFTPDVAFRTVFQVTQAGVEAGFNFVYKKTDSALRGNVGSELTAVLEATANTNIKFIPAFPKFNRVTKDGVHYVDGIPVERSMFGADPFTPVQSSRIKDIISRQSSVKILLNPSEEENGILVYDASTDEDLKAYGVKFGLENLRVSAGCAGFAPILADVLDLKEPRIPTTNLTPGLLVVSGSLTPVSLAQIEYAERMGMPRVSLTERKQINSISYEQIEDSLVEKIFQAWESTGSCIVDVGTSDIRSWGDTSDDRLKDTISASLGRVFKKLLDRGFDTTLMCIGGDTLQTIFRIAGITKITPLYEYMPGVVLSKIEYERRQYQILTKSGGFGDENLITELRAQCM